MAELSDIVRETVTVMRELLARTRADGHDTETKAQVQNNVITLTQLLEQIGELMGNALEATVFVSGTRNLMVVIIQFLVAKKAKRDTSAIESALNELTVVWRQNLQTLIDFVVLFQKKDKKGTEGPSPLEYRLWSYLNQLKKEKAHLPESVFPHESMVLGSITTSLESMLNGEPVPARILPDFQEFIGVYSPPQPRRDGRDPPSPEMSRSSDEWHQTKPRSFTLGSPVSPENDSVVVKTYTRRSVDHALSARSLSAAIPQEHRKPKNKRSKKFLHTQSNSPVSPRTDTEGLCEKEKPKKKDVSETTIISALPKHRGYIIKEILSSEQSYVEGLLIVTDVYQRPAIQGNFITSEELDKIILPDLKAICTLHQHFLAQLQERLESTLDITMSPDLIISDIFEDFIPHIFAPYSSYVIGYDKSMEYLQKQMEIPLFDTFLKVQKQSEPSKNKNLESYLITVIQRLPRYVLLLKELVNNTQKANKDYINLVQVLEKMQETVVRVNSEKKAFQMKEEAVKYHVLFGLEKEMPPTRTLIYLVELSAKQDKKQARQSVLNSPFKQMGMKKLKLLLFNDVIMLAKVQKEDELLLIKKYHLLETNLNNYTTDGDGTENSVKLANIEYYTSTPVVREELLKHYSQVMASYVQNLYTDT